MHGKLRRKCRSVTVSFRREVTLVFWIGPNCQHLRLKAIMAMNEKPDAFTYVTSVNRALDYSMQARAYRAPKQTRRAAAI